MPNCDGKGPLGTGPRTDRGLDHGGRRDAKKRSVEDPYWNEDSGRSGRPWDDVRRRAFGPGRKPTEDSAGPGATTHQPESFRRGQVEALLTTELDWLRQTKQVEALLTTELDWLRQMTSDYLRGYEDELIAEVEMLKRLLSEYLRGDAAKLTAELDVLGQMASEYLRSDAAKLTAAVDRLTGLVSECLRGDA